ncbi:MAG: DUF975 family protein [Prevotella sp.]
MKRNSEYKNQALAALDGKWSFAALVTIIYVILMDAPSSVFSYVQLVTAGLIATLLLLPLQYGYNVLWLGLVREEKVDYGTLFDGFKDYLRVLLTMLLVGIYTFLWSLLLIVPGIVKSYSYSMTPYILKDNPELSYDAAIEESMKLMSGHKMKLFLLDLSFIGWFILCCLTLGIGFIFLIPYMECAHARFYEDLRNAE